jgi:hypothetical protein
MRRLLVATALFFVLLGGIGGFALRAATSPTVVRVTTQQVHITTQEVRVDELFCHVEGVLRDPGVVYTFSQDFTCSATPIEMRRR